MLAAGPMRVNPRALSFPLDTRLLPLPKDGIFGELVGGTLGAGPVSAGIDTGANVRRLAPNLFLDPRTSYFYFSTVNPFVINLNKNNSGTGAHCMTSHVRFKQKTTKVWVGHLKPKRAYVNACPRGTRYTHDLAGNSYCKRGSCPRSHPVRRGANCHTSCGSLQTDAFDNCVK